MIGNTGFASQIREMIFPQKIPFYSLLNLYYKKELILLLLYFTFHQ